MSEKSPFNCPCCGSHEWHRWREIDSRVSQVAAGLTRPQEIRVTLCRCDACKLTFNHELLTGKEFGALYTEDSLYTNADYRYAGRITPKYTGDVLALLQARGARGRLLEVGFLDPNSLESFAAAGFEVIGCDLDESAVVQAQESGFTAFQGDLADLLDESLQFDVVVGVAILEHLEDPEQFLRDAAQLLSDRGLVVLQLPNASSLNELASRFSPHGWDMYGEPGHVYHYRRVDLERLLCRQGFETVAYRTATIRIRGKLPFLPGRSPAIERSINRIIHASPKALRCYTAFLEALDLVSLGDTHLIVARRTDE